MHPSTSNCRETPLKTKYHSQTKQIKPRASKNLVKSVTHIEIVDLVKSVILTQSQNRRTVHAVLFSTLKLKIEKTLLIANDNVLYTW